MGQLNLPVPDHRATWRSAAVLTPLLGLTAAQLVVGCDPMVAALMLAGLLAAFAPFLVFGFDLYTLLSAVFGFRYTGVAAIAKTAMGQPLQSFLQYPLPSYGLVAALLGVVALILCAVRLGDRGRGLLPAPASERHLTRLTWVCAGLGVVGIVLDAGSASRTSGMATTGLLAQVASYIREFYLLAVIAEVMRLPKGSKTAATPTLVGLLVVGTALALVVNTREFFAECLIAAAVALLLRGSVRIKYIVGGAVAAAFFASVVSPIILASRQYKYGQSATEAVGSTVDVATQALTKPGYMSQMNADRQVSERTHAQANTTGDYFGNQSNVLNRLSWIGLVDAVYSAAQDRGRLGWTTLPEMTSQLAPRFLYPDKVVARHIYGDWLAMQMGMEDPSADEALNFGLPMEGFVSFGFVGFILYPLVLLSALVLLLTRVASWRRATLPGVFLFCIFQHELFEGTSDVFIAELTRNVPIFALLYFALYRITRQPAAAPAPPRRSAAALPRARLRSGSPEPQALRSPSP